MRIKTNTFYISLFVIVIFSQLYLSSFRANIFLQIAVLGIILFIDKPIISKSLLRHLLPLLYLFLLGFTGTIIYNYQLINIIKDIFHFLKPILGLVLGFLIFRKINDFHLFVKIIVMCGVLSGVIHFIILISTGRLATGSITAIREFGRDNFLELFSFILISYYKKFTGRRLFASVSKHRLLLLFLLISNILYFSRTMIGVLLILLLSLYGYTIITAKTIKLAGTLVLAVVLLYTYLFSVKVDRSGDGIQPFLYKVKMAPAEIFTTRIDRDDHRDLWDHWRGYEAKRAMALMKKQPLSFVSGTGHGSLVNLKFYAPLTESIHDKGMKFISELHNGYVYVLYKTGTIGLLIYIFMLISIYKVVYKRRTFITFLISGIGLTFLFTTLTITGLYNVRDVFVFILGGLLFYNSTTDVIKPEPSS